MWPEYVDELARWWTEEQDLEVLRQLYLKSGSVTGVPLEIENVIGHLGERAEELPPEFYILLQDIVFRFHCAEDNKWTSMHAVFHNFMLMVAHVIDKDDIELPVEWVWDFFHDLVCRMVVCVNSKVQLAASTARSDDEDAILSNLWDPFLVEDILLRIIARQPRTVCEFSVVYCAELALIMYYFSTCHFHEGYQRLLRVDRGSAVVLSAALPTNLHPKCAMVPAANARPRMAAWHKEVSAVLGEMPRYLFAYYKLLYKVTVGEFGAAAELYERFESVAAAAGSPAPPRAAQVSRQLRQRMQKLSRILESLGLVRRARPVGENYGDADAEKVYSSALLWVCRPVSWSQIRGGARSAPSLAKVFMSHFRVAKARHENIALAALYHDVSLTKLAALSNNYDAEVMRADLLAHYVIQDDVVLTHPTKTAKKQYTEAFSKEACKAKALMDQLKKRH